MFSSISYQNASLESLEGHPELWEATRNSSQITAINLYIFVAVVS